jgi:hypothetical protein
MSGRAGKLMQTDETIVKYRYGVVRSCKELIGCWLLVALGEKPRRLLKKDLSIIYAPTDSRLR